MEKTGIIDAVLAGLKFDAVADPSGRQASPFAGFTQDDWKSFLRELNGFGLSPLFYSKYRSRAGEAGIPADFMEKLRAVYLANTLRNIRIYHVLKRILAAFHEAGIPLIVLKGAHIAELVYRDIGARVMSDLDVLIHETDSERAHRAMTSLGFRRGELHGERPSEGHHFHYSGEKTNILVEVHWRLFSAFYPFRFDDDVIWKSAREASLKGSPAVILSPEDLLLHVSAHSSIHLFTAGLRDLCDISEIVRSSVDSLDWGRILDQARNWRIVNCVYLTLLLASRLLGAEVPGRILDGLRPAGFDESLYEAGKRAMLSRGRQADEAPPAHPNLVLFFGRKGIRAKAGILIRKFFPSRETIAALYPVSGRSLRLPYFYLKWMATLFRRNADSAWSMFRESGKRRAPAAGSGADLAPLMSWLISR